MLGGAIGDAWGSGYENAPIDAGKPVYYLGHRPEKKTPEWQLTDDTQLTMITIRALLANRVLTPEMLARDMLNAHRSHALRGLGASTLKALQDLNTGVHWSLAGRSGEYAAGNGAAMRIAPLAFWNQYGRNAIRDFCRITHHNDEAYCGALAIVVAIRLMLNSTKDELNNDVLTAIASHLPDTAVRDRLLQLAALPEQTTIAEAAMLGSGGYVVESVPLAVFSATRVKDVGFDEMLRQLIACGGDTDTNASLAGHIAGASLGSANIPKTLINPLSAVRGFHALSETVKQIETYLPPTTTP